MLVDLVILFSKEFHIFIEEGKNECKYELTVGDGCKNLLWWPLVIPDVAIGMR